MVLNRDRMTTIAYFILWCVVFYVISHGGSIKYIVLATMSAIIIAIKRKIIFEHYIVMLHAMVYVCIGMSIAILTGNISFMSIKQSLIFLVSNAFPIILFSIIDEKDRQKNIYVQFVALCTVYIALWWDKIIQTFYNETSMYAFAFGAYVIYFAWKKRYDFAFAAFVFLIIENKRIAIGACAVGLIASLIIKCLKKDKNQRYLNYLIIVMMMALPTIWVLISYNGQFENVMNLLHINPQGRQYMWRRIAHEYVFSPSYLGYGSGWVMNWLSEMKNRAFSVVHNDFLVGYIELGFWGFIAWIAAFAMIVRNTVNRKGYYVANIVGILIIYCFLNMFTDNVYLYVTFIVPVNMMLLTVMDEK